MAAPIWTVYVGLSLIGWKHEFPTHPIRHTRRADYLRGAGVDRGHAHEGICMNGLQHTETRWLLDEAKGLREQLARERQLRELAEKRIEELEQEDDFQHH